MDKNLDKELGQILSRVFLLQSHLSKFPRRTWTRNLDNCRLPCYYIPGASLASKPPCTCPASEPRQPAESYGSYGSYGHTAAVWHSGCGIGASTRPRHLPSIGASAAAPRSQSCGQRRIAPLNPAANAGLLHSILRPTQDCST